MGKHSAATSRRGGASVGRIFNAALGVLGELLITVAIVLGLFAFWQVYWTSLEVAGPRDEAIAAFEDRYPRTVTVVDTGVVEEGEPPVFKRDLANGEVFGLIHVPKWDWLRAPITEGTGEDVINTGAAGHYIETAQPGDIGNFSVAGHRRTYGEIFQRIEELQPGDKVVVELDDYYLTYSVDNWHIVSAYDPENIRVVAPVPGDASFSQAPTERWMTMTTCHPDWGIRERWIVHLKYESWTKKSSGLPPALIGRPAQ